MAPPTRLAVSIAAPVGTAVELTPAISRDGRIIAFVGAGSGATRRIVVRSLDTFDTRTVAGTGGADAPFWSPDGRSLGFFAHARLWRVDLAGGLPRSIASVSDPRAFTAGTPVALFPINSQITPATQIRATGDSPYATVGDRILVTENEADPRASTINVLLNWTAPRR